MVVSLVGAWGACGGRGERRRDGVPVFSAHGQLDIHEAPRSNHIETRGAFLRLYVHERPELKRFKPLADTRGRNLGPKITAGGNSECRRQGRDFIPTEIYSREFDLLVR